MAINSETGSESGVAPGEAATDAPPGGSFYKSEQPLTAAQRRKLRKKQRDYAAQRDFDGHIDSRRQTALLGINRGATEQSDMAARLAALGLAVHKIQADGNCLFR